MSYHTMSCLSLPVSVCLCLSLSDCLSVCLSACLSVCLSDCLYVCLSACLTVSLSVCLRETEFVALQQLLHAWDLPPTTHMPSLSIKIKTKTKIHSYKSVHIGCHYYSVLAEQSSQRDLPLSKARTRTSVLKWAELAIQINSIQVHGNNMHARTHNAILNHIKNKQNSEIQ